jgi:hypothetical protein
MWRSVIAHVGISFFSFQATWCGKGEMAAFALRVDQRLRVM